MSATTVRMPHVERGSSRVRLPGPPAGAVIAAAFVGVLVLVFVALAVFDVYPSVRLAFVACAVYLATFAVGVVLLNTRVKAGMVRIDATADALRFVVPRAAPVLFFVAAIVGLVPGVVAIVEGFDEVGTWPAFFSAVSLVWLVQQLWALRLPAGLTLDARGIRGVRGSKPVDLGWHDLVRAEVTAPKGIRLVLHLSDSGTIVLEPAYIGSDPNVLAAVIDFFVEHPEHRGMLATPEAALRLVEETARSVAG